MRILVSLVAIAGLAGCTGKAPGNPGGGSADPDAGVTPDAPPLDVGQTLSGTAMDYFGAVPLADAAIASDGLDPQVTATSATDGAYTLEVAVGSKLFLVATKTGYRPTRSQAITVNDMPVTQDAYLMSTVDVTRQYTTLGLTATAGTAFVAADLQRNNGTPLEGIPLANVQLLDAQNQPVTGVVGPYFFGAAGDIDPNLATATAYGTPSRSRVAFLDVPPGSYTLAVTYTNGMGGNTQDNTTVSTAADGATMVVSGGQGGGGGGTNITDPSFATDIWPRLQRAADGGLGCANCHTAGGPAAVLPYDDPAATVLANMLAITGVIDTTTPAASLLLVKPLYEQPPTPQDHPNATFLDTNDPDYKLILLWITNGAKP